MFNSERLSIARKRRQLTKKALAERAGVSQLTLTRLETGETQNPEEDTVASLAHALGYPANFFFLSDCDEPDQEAVSFRSLSSLTARQRDSALSAGAIAYLLSDWVGDRFNLPTPNLIDLRDEDPEAAAIALRRHWGVGSRPIPHLLKLMEANGIRVFSLAENNRNVDAYSCWRGLTPFVFCNVFKSAERSRFDAAHELGHLCLHRHGANSGREAEREADEFASWFLVPRDDFIAHVPQIRSLEKLIVIKRRWGVSVAALARKAFDCGVLSEWHYRDLCKKISYRGYRISEPSPIDREQSVLWKKVLAELWKDGITKDSIARELGLPVDEIDSVVGGLLGRGAQKAGRLEKEFKLRAV